MEQDEPSNAAFYDGVRTENEKYKESGHEVLSLIEQGQIAGSHRISISPRSIRPHTCWRRR